VQSEIPKAKRGGKEKQEDWSDKKSEIRLAFLKKMV